MIICTIICVVILVLAVVILILVDKRCKKVSVNFKPAGVKYGLPAGGPFKAGQPGGWQKNDDSGDVMQDCLNSSIGDGLTFFCQSQNSDGSWSHRAMDMTSNEDICPAGSMVALVPGSGPGSCVQPLVAGNPNNDLCCTDANNCMNFPANQHCIQGKCLAQPGVLPDGLGYCG